MTSGPVNRPVESLFWDGPDLVLSFGDGPRETVRLSGAFSVSRKIEYHEDSGVVVEDDVVDEIPIGWLKNAP
jgi:hypothetical protein